MSRRGSFASAAWLAVLCGTPASAQDDAAVGSFNYDCRDGLSGSLKDDLYTCKQAHIWDERFEISAASAETKRLDFDQSEWQLNGDVHVSIDSAQLSADSATFVFSADELIAFDLVGSPAALSDVIDERNATLSGTAHHIAYDKRRDTVQLTDDVSFSVDDNEIATSAVTYNLEEQSFNTGSVRATLSQPDSESEIQSEQRDEP
jgi:lipopolysaccharide transport protein LptA